MNGPPSQWNGRQHEREWAGSHEKTWRHLKWVSLSERSPCGKAAHRVIPTVWHSGKGKTLGTVKGSVVAQGCRREGWTAGAERTFRATSLCVTALVDTCRYPLVHAKDRSRCQLWTLGDDDVSLWVHRVSQISPLTGDVDNGGGWAFGGSWETFTLPLNSALNLKLP